MIASDINGNDERINSDHNSPDMPVYDVSVPPEQYIHDYRGPVVIG